VTRGLGDVLHHFDPALAAGRAGHRTAMAPANPEPRAAGLRLLGVPMGPGDLLRAGAVWALAVEVMRRGAPARVLCPAPEDQPDPWPEEAVAPLGVRVHRLSRGARAEDLGAQAHRIVEAAGAEPGLCFLALPEAGFEEAFACHLDRALLLVACDRTSLREAGARIQRLVSRRPDARVGITVHGARSVSEAREAFEHLAAQVEDACGAWVRSYGLLVDDLALYRGIVERRAVGLARPQSPAARALADVARLLVEDLEGPDA